MKTFRKQDGFTLVEMLVTVVIGTVITAAAVTVLLLGLRVNKQSTDTVSRQNTTRILLSALESMATEGSITEIKTGLQSWEIITDGNTAFSYSAEKQIIYTGSVPDNDDSTVDGTPLLEGVYSSFVTFQDKQLTVTVETEEGSYSSSVYCRTVDSTAVEKPDEEVQDTIKQTQEPTVGDTNTEKTGREKFLSVLANQYRGTGSSANRGWIIDQNGNGTATYYAQWYNSEWPMKTPWCACFISWGLYESMGEGPQGHENWFANVDTFWNYFRSACDESEWEKKEVTGGTAWRTSAYYFGNYTPVPGDIVFFDWIVNGQDNPQHAGVVLEFDEANGVIYTIEGNTAGMVAIRKYAINDERILGYGVLNWKQQ